MRARSKIHCTYLGAIGTLELVKTPSTLIHIDPVEIPSDAFKKSDGVIVSHEHFDHFEPGIVREIHRNTGAMIVGNPSLHE